MSTERLIGMVFGKLTVIKYSGLKSGRHRLWKCLCECGKHKNIRGDSLKNGHTKSCGCLSPYLTSKQFTTHGNSTKGNITPEYRAWHHIKDRCLNSKDKRYHDYGGRGIKMFERWINSFENFLMDMGKRPSIKHSIDRFPNIDGDYEPGNCRWATTKEQSLGKRNNVRVAYDDKNITIAELSCILNTDRRKLYTWVKTKTKEEFINAIEKLRI